MTAIVDPLKEFVTASATALPSTDADVYLLNSLYAIHTSLALFQFTDARLNSLSSDMQLHLDTLASEQTSSLIANLELQPVLAMASSAKIDPVALKPFLVKFDAFLVAPDVYLLPQSRLLSSSSHRKGVTKRSLEVVAASYAQLFTAVYDQSKGIENPSALMPKTPDQVKLLLQL